MPITGAGWGFLANGIRSHIPLCAHQSFCPAYPVSPPDPEEASLPTFFAHSYLQGPFWSLHPPGVGGLISSLWATTPGAA